jgi:HEAT repeat protein
VKLHRFKFASKGHWLRLTGLTALLLGLALWLWMPADTRDDEAAPEPVLVPDPSPDDLLLDRREGASAEAELPVDVLSIITRALLGSPKAGRSVAELRIALLDRTQPLEIRRSAAWQLAEIGSDEALAVLRLSLSSAPAELKATIAEALGGSHGQHVAAVLKELLEDDQELVARGAIRGLAASANQGAGELLGKIVEDIGRSHGLRTEAALALGNLESGEAYPILTRLIGNERDHEIAEALLGALGRLPIEHTQEFFRAFLDSESVDIDLRVAALESLGQAAGNAAPLVLKYLQADDPEMRAAAAWAIANLENPGDVAGQLVSRLLYESELSVRTRLYQALQNQQALDSGIVSLVARETATPARVAGYQLLAQHLGRGSDAALGAQFDLLFVPPLLELALRGEDVDARLGSVIALKQANTPAAIRALATIRAESGEAKIAQAAMLH